MHNAVTSIAVFEAERDIAIHVEADKGKARPHLENSFASVGIDEVADQRGGHDSSAPSVHQRLREIYFFSDETNHASQRTGFALQLHDGALPDTGDFTMRYGLTSKHR